MKYIGFIFDLKCKECGKPLGRYDIATNEDYEFGAICTDCFKKDQKDWFCGRCGKWTDKFVGTFEGKPTCPDCWKLWYEEAKAKMIKTPAQ
jgi:hypothetical protein